MTTHDNSPQNVDLDLRNSPAVDGVRTQPEPDAGTDALETVQVAADTVDLGVLLDNPQQPKPAPVAKEEEEVPTAASLPSMQYVQEDRNVVVVSSTVASGKAAYPESVPLPPAASSSQARLLEGFPNLNENTDPKMRRWGSTFLQATEMSPAQDALEGAFARQDSVWRQGIEINGDRIRSVRPKFSTPNNATISGEQALQMSFNHMGIGDFFHAAMWNSGFWVTFKPAPDSVWLAINRLLGADVIRVNRETYGLLHSSATALTISTIIDSIIPYVYATSVNATEMPVVDIPKHLATTDEHDFIWGFICANYPDGFTTDRSCIADPSKCTSVTSERVMVTEMQVVDNVGLPEPNRNHMRQRGVGVMSLKSVVEYQDRLHQILDSVVTIKSLRDSEARVTFAVPSAEKKRRMSENYVQDVKDSVLASVNEKLDVPQRESIYNEMTTATEMRMYQHWVKAIEIGSNVIEDEVTIANILGQWTRDHSLRREFFEKIAKFIDNSSMSAIGLEPFKCPVCGADHNRPEQKARGYIDYVPVDIVQVFSHLAEFRTRLIQVRA